MRKHFLIHLLSASVALALLGGCSSGSGVAPGPVSPQGAALSLSDQHFASHFSCPASGPLEYVSDGFKNVIHVYAGNFAGQSPCGEITKKLSHPSGLFVQPKTHDLYVANQGSSTIEVFHRGQTSPSNQYEDPTRQHTFDVTIATDGTVIASNILSRGEEAGSLSTWRGGPNGGTFVGNFPFGNGSGGGTGLFVTVKKNGTVYFDEFNCTTKCGELWSLSCPMGVCGVQTQVAGVAFNNPGGLAIDAHGDLLVTDSGPGAAETFHLPNPTPSTFPLLGSPFGMAINRQNKHWFVADEANQDAAEYSYPSGRLIGTVPCCSGGDVLGIAVDSMSP